jgi:hypothetical protein
MAISLAPPKPVIALVPRRILVRAAAGIGKTSFASRSDNPAVVLIEDDRRSRPRSDLRGKTRASNAT